MKKIWPFEEQKNVGVFTTRHVIRDKKTILFVFHDEDDGAWQFHSGDKATLEDAYMVSLQQIYDIDNSVGDIADLPPGWKAWRSGQGESWRRGIIQPSDI